MRNSTSVTQEALCEECGLPQQDWRGNHGRGIQERNGRACCVGCAEGLGCDCKESGVRRVVIVKSEENKTAYVKKMDRQMKDWQSRIKQIEQNAKLRGAEGNSAIKGKLSELSRKASSSTSRIASVKASGRDWGEKAKGASMEYRRMKAAAEDLGARIKKK